MKVSKKDKGKLQESQQKLRRLAEGEMNRRSLLQIKGANTVLKINRLKTKRG